MIIPLQFIMEVFSPLLTISFIVCNSILRKKPKIIKSFEKNKKFMKYYRNQKALTSEKIQEIKKILYINGHPAVNNGKIAEKIYHIQGKKLLLLDLDKTLIFAKGINGIVLRPFVRQLLQALDSYYRIFVFTAGTKEYAESIFYKFRLDFLKIQGFLHREHCTNIRTQENGEKIYIKDLNIIRQYSFKEKVIVDDTPVTYCLNPMNAIPILPFYGDQSDTQLLKIIGILQCAYKYEDIRVFIKENKINTVHEETDQSDKQNNEILVPEKN